MSEKTSIKIQLFITAFFLISVTFIAGCSFSCTTNIEEKENKTKNKVSFVVREKIFLYHDEEGYGYVKTEEDKMYYVKYYGDYVRLDVGKMFEANREDYHHSDGKIEDVKLLE